MILKIDSRWPIVWRDPFTIQVGIDPPRVVLDRLTSLEERLVSSLVVGMTRAGLTVVAEGQNAVVDALLARLAPVLQGPHPRSVGASIAMSGNGRLVDLTSRLLGEAGMHVLVADSPAVLDDVVPDLAIAVGHGVLPPLLHSLWLRRDVPHLPVLFTDSAVHLGPIVEPGYGPCLVCLELHRRDSDEAWPAIATQLLSRAAAREPPELATEAAAAVCRLAVKRLEGGVGPARSLRISVSGERSFSEWTPHPECGCRGLGLELSPTRAGRGSDSDDARPANHRSPLPTRATTADALE